MEKEYYKLKRESPQPLNIVIGTRGAGKVYFYELMLKRVKEKGGDVRRVRKNHNK